MEIKEVNKVFDVIEKSEKYNYEVCLSKDKKVKTFRSPTANYNFNLETGRMISWGKTLEEDPSEFVAPNILDMEITDICEGVNGKVCPFCYKANLPTNGNNMDFTTFKKIFNALPKSVTQIAFGLDSHATSNPYVWAMMSYARMNYIIPNVTVAQIDEETADKIAKHCGAVAVSRYHDEDACYDSIKLLTDRGMKQVNMHFMISEETYERCLQTMKDIKYDKRLDKLNALVLLSLKKKGRGVGFHPLSQEKFDTLIETAKKYEVPLGFDSCSSLKVFRAYKDDFSVRNSIIPCEASIESSYINLKGEYYPCSFCEGEKTDTLDWTEGINVLECSTSEDFLDKVWFNKKTSEFKKSLKNSCKSNCEDCRCCPMFEV